MSMVCEFCGESASLKCAGCQLVFYCNREHQKLDWKKGHKMKCKGYEVFNFQPGQIQITKSTDDALFQFTHK